MTAALQSLLTPQVLTRVISRQAGASDWLLSLFGVAAGGANEISLGHGREGSYNIYDNVRKVGKVTAPGNAANRRSPNPMATVTFTYPRLHDSVSLSAEVIHNIGRIDDPQARDIAGQQYITRQTGTLGMLAANFRKVQLAGALRDSLFLIPDGEAFTLDFAAGSGVPAPPIPQQMPAGNKGQLDMLGGGDIINASWLTSTTDIVSHFGQINAAFQELNGGHLAAAIMPFQQWNNIIKNDTVQEVHGTSTSPFVTLQQGPLDQQIGNTMLNVMIARLNFAPSVTCYITDEGFDLGVEGSEVFKKLVPDTNVIFIGHNPSDETVSAYIAGEPVAEFDGGPESMKTGLNAWSTKTANPTATNLFALDNALVVNHVPDSVAFATTEF